MANTPNFNLYKPSRADTSVEVDVSLTDNFTKIDTELKTNKDGLAGHISNPNAHTSENVSHADGSVKITLDNHEERIGGLETDADALEVRVTDIETLGLDVLAPTLEGRIQTIESDVEGFLAPATFDAMDQQSYTFDEYRIGYVNNKMDDIAVNVKTYGAKGDGVSDDTTAIQNAIDDAVANLKSLFFPHGKYKITSGLVVQHTDNTRWQPGIHIHGVAPGMSQDGVRYGSIIAPTSAVTGPALSVIGTANTDNSYKGMANGTVVENLGILGVNGGSNGDGFYFKYFVNLTVRNCWSMYNNNGFTFARQANGATFGYGFGVTLDRIFSVSNRGWGIHALDAGSVNLTMLDPTLQNNLLGGIKAAGGPIICQAGGFYGNGGPAVLHDDATGASAIFGPHFYGTRFETNNTSTLGPQVELVSANMPVFDACWFLTSTEGEHGIKMGEDATKIVYRPTLRNCHFGGKSSVTTQNAYIIGNNCQGAVIENCRELNYTAKFGGVAGLKSDILYIEAGNQIGNPVNIVRTGVSRALATNQTGDAQPRFSINSNGDHTWGDGTSAIDVSLSRETANRLTLAAGDTFRITDGTWNGGNLILGAYRLWIDGTGKLRMKSGAPTSDTDGTVVGTQA